MNLESTDIVKTVSKLSWQRDYLLGKLSIELKVISSPEQFVQLPVIKIFNFLGLFSKHQRKQLIFFFIFLFFKFLQNLLLIKEEFLLKRLVSINFSRLFYKDLYFFIYINIYQSMEKELILLTGCQGSKVVQSRKGGKEGDYRVCGIEWSPRQGDGPKGLNTLTIKRPT